jgi:outer membrane protein, heavy metal efflux system
MNRPCARVAAFALAIWSAAVAPRPVLALDLPEALRQAAAANPSLAARSEMVEAARRRVARAGSWPSPMLELGVVNVPTTGRFDEDPMTMKMIGVSQRVPVFGGNRLSGRAARESASGEAAALERAGFEIYGMTWEAYADALAARDRVRSAEAHGGVMDRLVESSRVRYQSGTGRLEDMLRSQAERARIVADLTAFRAEEQTARARLDALRGVPPGGPADTLAALPAATDPLALEAWLAAVSAGHPRLREADAQAGRYRFEARAARRMAWPDLELKASYGWRQSLVSPGHAGSLEQDNMISASIGFMLPVFAGARGGAEGAEMDAMARASEAERRQAELELRQEIVSAHAAAVAAGRTVRLFADTVTSIQHRAVEASWAAYRAGTTDLWRILEATHALYAEELALVRARQELARAHARLVALTGRADLLGVTLPTTRSDR